MSKQFDICVIPSALFLRQHELGIRLNASSDSVGLGWGQRVWMSDTFPDDINAAGPQNTLCVIKVSLYKGQHQVATQKYSPN